MKFDYIEIVPSSGEFQARWSEGDRRVWKHVAQSLHKYDIHAMTIPAEMMALTTHGSSSNDFFCKAESIKEEFGIDLMNIPDSVHNAPGHIWVAISETEKPVIFGAENIED